MPEKDFWDTPPFPDFHDRSRELIYMSVGRALSYWERFELDLACLYATFLGIRPTQAISRPEYKSARIFRERANVIDRAGSAFFIALPNQALESETEELLRESRLAANRRNDIAHGVVGDLWSMNAPAIDYVKLFPSNYKRKDFDDVGSPRYALSSRDINHFSNAFQDLGKRAIELNNKIGP
jgi:hypothetical protein